MRLFVEVVGWLLAGGVCIICAVAGWIMLLCVCVRFLTQHSRPPPPLSPCNERTNKPTDFVAATRIEKGLGIPVLRHATKKPGAIPEVLAYFQRENVAGPETRERDLCIVGDRLLTDVMWGNGCGMLTVHTQILTAEGDNKVAGVVRRVEGRVGRVLGGRGWEAPPHPYLAKYLAGVEANKQKREKDGGNGAKPSGKN